MAFEKKIWVNIPDPTNMPPVPEGQDELAIFDADNMNRIEGGIKEAHEVLDSMPDVLPINKGGTGATTAEEALKNLGAIHIAVGTYTGTGTCGEENPNRIPVDGKAKYARICGEGKPAYEDVLEFFEGVPEAFSVTGDKSSVVSMDREISWYTTNATNQLNVNGEVYQYLILYV